MIVFFYRQAFTIPESDLTKYSDIRIISIAVAGGYIEEDVLKRIAGDDLEENFVRFTEHGTPSEIASNFVEAICQVDPDIVQIPITGTVNSYSI